ncbi:MAG: hydrogen gas-evolving membrane-bound hydrogenase subunit E, partial [Paracoccaceae bacterium]|nr:hydrogen gas-evolving membrane-bound hydrogenase subunit E [Paracoccaceae bacterium]
KAAAVGAIFHIINHATFKAALFMSAGIVDHEANTRDIKRLGGLRTLMPITFGIVTLAALSMAGIPPLNGFLSKEMMLEEAVHTVWAGNPWVLAALATVGAMFSVAYSFRLIGHVFLGPVRDDYPARPHDPGFGMWAAPALLAALVVVIGVAPMVMVGDLVAVVAGAVTGEAAVVEISHWHGFVPALFLSLIAVAGGAVILGLHRPLNAIWLAAPRPEAKAIFDAMIEPFARAARSFTDALHDGALTRYMAIATLAILGAGVLAYQTGTHLPGTRALTPVAPVAAVGWILLMGATVSLFAFHRNRLLALVLVGVVGLMVSVGFAYMSAPDLALTQISVEVATVILLLLALNFLPKVNPVESSAARRARDGIIAAAAGLGVGGLIYALMTRDFAFPSIADYHLANSYTGGGGTNVVNVILVDFRGYDTFGEITVLGIAALVIFALTEALLLAGPANDRLLGWLPDQKRAGDRHPLMLVVATRMILPVALMVGVYIFLRGHNAPGGGFIAGLVVAIALVMQYMASGFGWAQARQKVDYHAMIASGVVVAGLCGVGAWFANRPFLTSAYGYVHPPLIEKFELATAMIFDTGVFLTVVGAVMLALASISRIAIRAGETVNIKPFDIEPGGTAKPKEAR